ncbi:MULTISPECIES: indolepyruvate oxidoreductase subunit beta family protein [Ramlibacter]|uniref:Indolepyruvate oxidoreductase subunit beta family protein n=1 Tax=Ramlibacter pinisoli TaxID=2682844 RepID=A0A6N8IVK9_9BURK|nr:MULTISPECIES: indolepyruvate oxidoreductase subunit beta family protein [Ramlibacter]MBA2961036.1 indolepyruvate oxidoreductase subunit beta family protein [Ramlibacter sp. CGMCC 1.13660]MVQ30981.1 indolepyruvate oxidoreductase subunit beta family protein [Ramlibacter pinisoli]
MTQPRAITIALLAMGGEGGGVLSEWLVDLAEHHGYLVQATSVPGVAQRTGATVYYLELFPRAAVPADARPVLALSPVPGEVDVVIASELMEAGRALQRGLVSSERTTFIVSTHRVYSMTERTAMGDGRVDAPKLLDGARAAAARLVAADFAAIAEQAAGPIAPALFGALAASGALPFERAQFEEAIRRGGVGVQASLKAFAAGHAAALAPEALPPDAVPPVRLGPRLAALDERIGAGFPLHVQDTLRHGVLRLADFQDVPYAAAYLDLLQPLRDTGDVLTETARHLALWMTYEDAIRVADLKTRRSRFDRVAGEVKLTDGQLLHINEFMHPRVEEIADILPAGLGRWLLATGWARGALGRFTRSGRIVRTSSLRGFLLLYAIAALRPLRPRSLRFGVEQERIRTWLAGIQRLAGSQPALALELARSQRLVKGYGDTHARGWRNFQRLLGELPRLEGDEAGARRLSELARAALADESGQALEHMLASA